LLYINFSRDKIRMTIMPTTSVKYRNFEVPCPTGRQLSKAVAVLSEHYGSERAVKMEANRQAAALANPLTISRRTPQEAVLNTAIHNATYIIHCAWDNGVNLSAKAQKLLAATINAAKEGAAKYHGMRTGR